ncbi:MAG: hypothetical protein ACR2LL_10470 [Nitrosopumilus sp.]|uniref:hypothetical protein n=1 Tax=Nitrosopumilus sp. TaxID=2024843 RepID=UPI00292FF9A1|nr:hypothetical protein [Nitrosopumilus sp.]
MNNPGKVLKKLKEKLIRGILICISCGSDKVIRDNHTLHCKICNYAYSYEVAA